MKATRFFTIAAALCTACTAASPFTALAADNSDALTFIYEGIIYTVEGVGKATSPYLTVKGYADDVTDADVVSHVLQIPATLPQEYFPPFEGSEKYKSLPVTTIAENAFKDCRELNTLVIPETISHINENAFKNCTSIEQVEFGEREVREDYADMLNIGFYAFSGCKKLEKIKLPAHTYIIEPNAFYDCTNLKKAEIYADSIMNDAFGNCKELADVYLYTDYTIITEHAFYNEARQSSDAIVPNLFLFYGTLHCHHDSKPEEYAKTQSINYAYITELSKNAGDLNDDGTVSVDDAQLALSEYTTVSVAGNPSTLEFNQRRNGDINRDGKVTVEDAQLILKYYVQNNVAGTPITWEDLMFGKPEPVEVTAPAANGNDA